MLRVVADGIVRASEEHLVRHDLRRFPGVGLIPPEVAGERAVRLKPHVAAAVGLALPQSLEAELGLDIILFAKKIGPAFIAWGGPSIRAGLMYRF